MSNRQTALLYMTYLHCQCKPLPYGDDRLDTEDFQYLDKLVYEGLVEKTPKGYKVTTRGKKYARSLTDRIISRLPLDSRHSND